MKQKAPGSAGGFLFLLTNLEIVISNNPVLCNVHYVIEIKKKEVNMRVNLYISI